MDVNTVAKIKLEMENKIKNEIERFEKDSGCKVEYLEFERVYRDYLESYKEPEAIKITTKVVL